MIDSKFINDLSSRLSALLPSDLGVLRTDVEDNMRATLQGAFQRLDLVTREEFDVQSELLARTRTKVEALEQRLDALEKELSEKGESAE